MSGTSPDSLKSSAEKRASGLLAFLARQLDRIVSPDARQIAYNAIYSFYEERPLLASFVFAQILFSFIPILLFGAFVLSVAAFAFGVALIFTLFWAGVALFVLVPTLVLTSSFALIAYAWALSSFLITRQMYSWIVGPEEEPRALEHGTAAPASQGNGKAGNTGVVRFDRTAEKPAYTSGIAAGGK